VVVIPSGLDSGSYDTANTTYYFAPGTHTVGTESYNAIGMGANDWYVGQYSGGTTAILSGAFTNQYGLISQHADAVSSATADHVEYMTIEEFTTDGVGISDIDGASGYLYLSYNLVTDNLPGNGAMLGTADAVTYNCFTANGDYGTTTFCGPDGGAVVGCNASTLTLGPQNVTEEYNEISYNDQCNWEAVPSGYWPITVPSQCGSVGYNGCGCAGGAHFWFTDGSVFSYNYVHDNFDTATWWDTDNNGETIEYDYYANNFSTGTDLEISYNAVIEYDNYLNNGWGVAECATASGNPCYTSGNLAPAIYISESAGNPHVVGNAGATSGYLTISGDNFANNWDGVAVYQSPDRFCGSPYNTSTAACTLGANVYNAGETFTASCGSANCYGGGSGSDPTTTYWANCSGTGTSGCPGTAVAGGCGVDNLTGATPSGANPDYYDNCVWKAQNVTTTGDTFSFAAASVGGCPSSWGGCGATVESYTCATSGVSVCAENGLAANCPYSGLSWNPYYATATPGSACGATGNAVPDALIAPTTTCLTGFTFTGCIGQANDWSDNTYTHTGTVNWSFMWQLLGAVISISTWQGHGQDSGSTFS
jgi:hypothetical protein